MEGRERCRAVTPMGPKMADLLVAYLEQLGVEYVFGVPGGAIEPLYDALARSERRGGVRAVVARHETGAAFMADGYARNSGKLGVCCSTTGPGATNMITGVASAYENNVPMLVITAQTAISTFGKGAIQDSSCTGVNTVGLYSHCTRYNTLISHIDQLVLHYQPQIDFKTGDLLGAEALVRWEHPLKGLVSPDDFIPLAEESGLINQLTDWVLKNVAVQTKH